MRVLMLSWEYPPVVVGGLGRHVHALATQLAAQRARGRRALPATCRHGRDHAPQRPICRARASGGPRGRGPRALRLREGPAGVDPRDGSRDDARRPGSGSVATRTSSTRTTGWSHTRPWRSPRRSACRWWRRSTRPRPGGTRLAVAPDEPAGALGGVVAGERGRLADHVFFRHAARGGASVRCGHRRGFRAAQRHRAGWLAGAGRGRRRRPASYSPHGDPLLLFFGRIEWEKGIQDLIAALPRIRRLHRGTRVVMAGGGSQTEWLQEQARKHRVLRAGRSSPASSTDTTLGLLSGPTRSCCPPATSRSGSWRWRPRRPELRGHVHRGRAGRSGLDGVTGCPSSPVTWRAHSRGPRRTRTIPPSPGAARRTRAKHV